MYIEQAFKGRFQIWRYILGTIIIVLGMFVGQLPLVGAIMAKYGVYGMQQFSDEASLMKALDSNLTFFLILLSFAVALLVLLFVVKVLHKQTITSLTTSRKKIDWRRFWFSFSVIAVLNIVMVLVDCFIINPENYEFHFQLKPFLILTVIAIVMIPLQTSFEEYLFRGYLMQGIGANMRYKWVPLVITSVVFGGLHYSNPEVSQMGDLVMVTYIGTGFMLGIMTLMDEGLELSLGFHSANNLVASLLVTADWTAFNTESIFKDVSKPVAGWDVWIGVLVIYPLILIIYAKRYQWNNWRNKLFGRVEKPVVSNTISEDIS
ncbi:CPBP family intramembrane glutamic endopeptidase [Zunongwangia sp.]|uniref:CPBP family intramembrane glutamic endopeptidase n=1 Tax=Zunongwangia sp. TaxID=1965325 RepID=UPI003AA86A49